MVEETELEETERVMPTVTPITDEEIVRSLNVSDRWELNAQPSVKEVIVFLRNIEKKQGATLLDVFMKFDADLSVVFDKEVDVPNKSLQSSEVTAWEMRLDEGIVRQWVNFWWD